MRGIVGTGSRNTAAAAVLGVAIAGAWPGAAARAQMADTAWLETSSFAYDALANCLARAMSGQFVAAPVVFAPPRRTAYVNLWPRARAPVDPVAMFHVEQGGEQSRIGWQRLANASAGARWDAAAKVAARRCATAGR
jgi:hypothetical protein